MIKARYIKILIDGGYYDSTYNGVLTISEVEAYSSLGSTTNIALGKICTAAAYYTDLNNNPSLATDGSIAAYQNCYATPRNSGYTNLNGSQWLKVDLGVLLDIAIIKVSTFNGSGFSPITDYRVQVSEDDISYTTVKTITGMTATSRTDSIIPIVHKTNIQGTLDIGDHIYCKYTSSIANTFGIFSDLGTKLETSGILSATPSDTVDGYFNFVFVGYDLQDRKKFVADRNIQNLSWDVLNTAGVASGSGLSLNIDGRSGYTIRLLSGGVSNTDSFNEWDKIIVESTLNGLINAGDNSIWNWNVAVYTCTSTRQLSNMFVVRGYQSPTYWYGGFGTNTTVGFRPVLLIDTNKLYKMYKTVDNKIYGMV